MTTRNLLKCDVIYLRVFALWVFILLSACGPGEHELRRYMQEVKTRSAKPIEPIPTFASSKTFSYPEDIKRRNPFKPLKRPKKQSTLAPDVDRKKQPLEAFPLDALKFVGTLQQGSTTWGLISQPGGLIVRIKPGDYIGKDYGQIIRVTNQSIRIQEMIKTGGRWQRRIVNMKLHKP